MPADSPSATLQLPERLDRSAALGLKEQLDSLLGQGVTIDASATESVGGLALQVIHFAKQHWATSGWAFEVIDASDTLAESLAWLAPENTEQSGESEAWL